jgi:hypothetical protein
MVSKEDPLKFSSRTADGKRTVWLDKEGMDQARESYWKAYAKTLPDPSHVEKRIWDVAFAAAIAAHSFVWEGKLEAE